jgi:hypothetical protein
MPAPHDLDPQSMTDEERRAKRIQDAAIGYELDGNRHTADYDRGFSAAHAYARIDIAELVKMVLNYAVERPGFYYSRDSERLDEIRNRYGLNELPD